MVRSIALVLTALTGFSGLVYEVAWQKYVATLLGSHSEATAAVLALFLGGLSIGYSVFGRVTQRLVENAARRGEQPRLLLLYGVVEASVGLHALVFPWLFAGIRVLSLSIPHQVSGTGFALDVLLVGLLILPPTVLMGATIPILTQALSLNLADSTRLHALVYASNTTGAFAGALAAGFLLVPWLGLESVVRWMGVVNLIAGSSFLLLGFRQRGVLGIEGVASEKGAGLGLFAPVALLSGFAAMALQTVLIRVGGLAIGSSEFTFSMMVSVFVLCIAVGSFAVSAFSRIPRSLLLFVQAALAVLLLLLYSGVGDSSYWVHVVRSAFRDDPASFYFYYFFLFVGVLGVLAVPVGLSGATLPLIFHELRREFGGLGSAAGTLYAWNTVGSLLGALLGGYLLLFWLDLDQVYGVAVSAILASVGLLAIRRFGISVWASVALVPVVALPFLLPRWDPDRLASGLFRVRAPSSITLLGPDEAFSRLRNDNVVAFYTDDPASSVCVLNTLNSEGRIIDVAILTNGKPDGSIRGDYPTMALAGLVSAILADDPRSAFVIGFGTGVTVGELAALDSIESVVVAEISPGVIEAGREFEQSNQGALSSPKTSVIVSDAYRALQGTDATYDLIVSEPSNPWVAGVEMLYSEEFLTAARSRLTPGGVYAQWFHLYETDSEVVSLVLRTYASVFDRVAVWFTLGPDLILLGFNDDDREIDLAEMERRVALPDYAAGLKRARVNSFPALLSHEILPVGVLESAALEGDTQTLLHPVLNRRAARAFFSGRQGNLPRMNQVAPAEVGDRNSLLARYRRANGGQLSDPAFKDIAEQRCGWKDEMCAVTLTLWAADHPDSELRRSYLKDLRKKYPKMPALQQDLLDDLARLLGTGEPGKGRIALAEVKRLTNLFDEYYDHSAGFDRAALVDIWRRCKDGNRGVSCSESWAEAEGLLGPLRDTSSRVSH